MKLSAVAALGMLTSILLFNTAYGADGLNKKAADDKDPIRVGVILALSGGLSIAGVPMLNAIKAITDETNSHGGVNGHKIELLIRDGKGDPTESAHSAVSVINDGAVVIIGATLGQDTLALAPIAASKRVPVLAPNATIAVTDPSSKFFPWVFRLGASDRAMLGSSWDKMMKNGYKRIAIVYSQDAYGKFGTDLMTERAEKTPGVKIVATVSAALGATDVTAQAIRVRDAKPDVVVLNISSPSVSVGFLRASQSIGLDVPMFGGIGVTLPSVLKASAGFAGGRLVAPGVYDPSNPLPKQKEVFDLIKKHGFEAPVNWSLFGVAGIKAVIAASEKVGSDITGAKIRDALESGMKIDVDHSAPLSYSVKSHDGYGDTGVVWLKANKDGMWSALQ